MWRMYGLLRNGLLTDIGSRRYVTSQQLPHPIVEVDVTLAGPGRPATHWGWMQAGKTAPSSIWPTEDLYRTCFHGTPEEQESAGYGRTVRLSVQPVGRLATQ